MSAYRGISDLRRRWREVRKPSQQPTSSAAAAVLHRLPPDAPSLTGVAADAIEAPSRARRRSALPKNAPNSLKLRPCPSRRGQVGFVIGTAIVAISQNPVIEIGVATPYRACIRNFLRSGSSREFVASEASFGRTAVVTNATAKLGRSIANSFQYQ
jgi:hypothetical protein